MPIQHTPNHPPLYRVILRRSLNAGWREWRLWVFAVLAGLLQTGGIIDMAARALTITGRALPSGFADSWFTRALLPAHLFSLATLGLKTLFVALVLLAAFIASVIAQGALVAGLEKTKTTGSKSTLLSLIHRGGSTFWPVATLNILTLGLLWCARFLLLIPLAFAARAQSFLASIGSLIAFTLFVVAMFLLTAIHLFALQAIVRAGKTINDALVEAWHHFWRNWLLVVEVAFLLVVISVALSWLGMFISVFSPILLLFYATALLGNILPSLLLAGFAILVIFAIGCFLITFQYACWGQLYDRLGEGTAHAKIHRVLHRLIG